jgi:CelD/BcsL family acetyltransferase involved in cellulose biosynthesis
MREYKFLSGGEAYKGRFANEDPGLETIALARGVRGRASLLGTRTALALPPERRRWLGKLAGS